MKVRTEGRDNRRGFYRNKLIATMIIVMGVVISINSADNKTEFGVMDDFTVWGVEGTLDDPDLEIKGFSVFGATQTAYTASITNGPGNVMINGVLGVSSGAYIAGISTISYINNINTSSLTITGNGITGSSPLLSVAGSTMVILNNGNVGIGTTGPSAKLSVQGTGTSYGLFVSTDSGGSIGNLVVNNSGNVGIGTTEPQQKLDIKGNLALGTGNFVAANTNNGLSIRGSASNFNLNIQDGDGRVNFLWNATKGGGTYIVSDEPAARILEGVNGTTGGLFGFYGAPAGTAGDAISWTQIAELRSASNIWLSPRGTNSDFYINSSGKVGIGTTNPGYKLDVNGPINGTSVLINGIAVGAGGTQWASGSDGVISYTGGNVGIGTTSPTAKLHIYGDFGGGNPATSGLYVYNTQNSPGKDAIITARVAGPDAGDPFISLDINTESGWTIGVDNSDGNKFKIDRGWAAVGDKTDFVIGTNGNVGIGTTEPNAKLHVSGGDIAVTTQSNGVILRATDGSNCYRVTVNNLGALSTALVTCP